MLEVTKERSTLPNNVEPHYNFVLFGVRSSETTLYDHIKIVSERIKPQLIYDGHA